MQQPPKSIFVFFVPFVVKIYQKHEEGTTKSTK